jgi:hypothetical protein
MSEWRHPLHAMRYPVSHFVTKANLELRNDGAARLVVAKAQPTGNHASDGPNTSGALDAAFEDFQEIQNRNAEKWRRRPVVDVEVVADDMAETFYLMDRVGRPVENVNASRSDLERAGSFYRLLSNSHPNRAITRRHG